MDNEGAADMQAEGEQERDRQEAADPEDDDEDYNSADECPPSSSDEEEEVDCAPNKEPQEQQQQATSSSASAPSVVRKSTAKQIRPAKVGGKKKRKKQDKLHRYVYKVLRQVHPEVGISAKSMAIMNNFLEDIMERITTEGTQLSTHAKRSTLSTNELQTAVRLILPGELAKHAVAEGSKAVSKYKGSAPTR